MKRRTTIVMLALAGPLLVAPGAPSADASSRTAGHCNSGKSCLFEDDSFAGGRHQTADQDPDFYNNYWAGTARRVEDGGSSIYNTRGCVVRYYEHDSYLGASYTLPTSYNVSDLGPSGFEDEISSFKPTC